MEMGKVIQKNGLLLPGIVYDIVPSTISYPILLSGGRIAAIVGFFFPFIVLEACDSLGGRPWCLKVVSEFISYDTVRVVSWS